MNGLQWLQFMLSYFLQASLVIAVAWALEHWTGSAQVKTRIWTACFVSLLGLLAVGLTLPRLDSIHPWSRLGPRELLAVANTELVLGRSLLAIWSLGTGVMLVRWIVQFLQLQAFIDSCPRITDQVAARMRRLAPAELRCTHGRQVEFRVSPEDLGPFCYQFHQPIVFLPKSFFDGDESELQHVLVHELTHLKTEHPRQLFAQKLVQTTLWFHPLAWMSGRRASLVREFVCDDAATHDRASTASYLKTLLRIVEQRPMPHSGALTIGRTPGELRLRAKRLVGMPQHSTARWGESPIWGVLLAAAAASQLWLPTNPLASPTNRYSPWPTWTAAALHTFDLSVRDFESFEARRNVHELVEDWQEENLSAHGASTKSG